MIFTVKNQRFYNTPVGASLNYSTPTSAYPIYLKRDTMNLKKIYSISFIIPAIIMFFIALIPTLKYGWPLSWDIMYHVGFAKVYSQYGYVLTDPIITPNYKILYPPLFHFLIAGLGSILHIDYFQIARFLQPVLAMSIVLSVSYVAKKLYGNIAGISAGFLVISSYIAFRIVLPLPENLALIFLIFSVYFYYISISDKNLKYALISGILLLLTLATHQSSPLLVIIIISAFTLLELVLYRNKSVLKNYGVFLIFLAIIIAGGVFALLLLKPELLNNILQQGMTVISHISAYEYTKTISLLKYAGYLGVFVLIFSVIGGVIAVKMRQKKGIFLLTWAVVLFLLSNAYLIGIDMESARFLIYILIPLSILGGYGVKYTYYKLKEYPRFSSLKFRSAFLISIFVLSTFLGVLTAAEKPVAFYAETPVNKIQIAPPSPSEVDVVNWFKVNGDKEKSMIISNRYFGMFLSAAADMPLNTKFGKYNNETSKSAFNKNNITYIVYDKRLTFPSKNGTLYMKNYWSQLYYYSGDIHDNIDKIIPSFAKVVYENDEYIICEIEK